MIYTSPNSKLSSIMGTSPDDLDMPKQGSDRVLLVSVIVLMVIGVLAVYSSIAFFAESNQTTAGSLVVGHAMKLGIAFLVMLIFSKIDYHLLARMSRFGMIVSWGLLIALFFWGEEAFGARRALSLGGISFQPSSVAGVALLIHVAVLLDEKQDYVKDFKRTFLPVMFWVVVTCGLIGIQDFSSAALLMALCVLIMFIGRISTLHLGGLMLLAVLGGSALVMTSAERQSRIQQYVDQVVDINATEFSVEEGYQAQQAHIAIAQGQIFGVGMGKSTQRDFLPAPYNDFIFAIVAEEYGLVGSVGLILIFTLILIRGVGRIAKNAPDICGKLLATACTLYIVFYGFVNAGVASGLLPVTGLPMPFVSYGGTSTLFAGLMVGILLNISKHDRKKRPVFYA